MARLYNQQPTTNNQQPTTNNQQPTTNNSHSPLTTSLINKLVYVFNKESSQATAHFQTQITVCR
jgi:hypothetical protein